MKIVSNGPNWDAIKEAEKCLSCNGSGYYDYSSPKTGIVPQCASCNGTGKRI